MIAFEIQHFIRRKNQGKSGYAALKLDMIKAYDRVEWDLLRSIMLRMGFSEHWVKLILVCVSTVMYSILNEGMELGPVILIEDLDKGIPYHLTFSSL